MKTKVVFSNSKFYINYKENTITCVLFTSIDLYSPWVYMEGMPSLSPVKVVGIAKCNERDTFDINKGKKIALSKAKIQGFEICKNKCKKYINTMRNTLQLTEKIELACSHAKQAEQKHLYNLSF